MDRRNRELFLKIKKYFNKDYSYKAIIQKVNKKYNVDVSLRTLCRIFKDNKLKRKNIKESTVQELTLAILIELEGSGYNLGYKSMWKRLRKVYDLKVKQKTVMNLLKKIDPEGVESRSRYRLKRRIYCVPGPNFVWHADGHDKLKRFGFAIYGFIDGYSRKVLSLDVATTNNHPEIIGYYYLKLIEKCGFIPTLIRTDHGSEIVLMEDFHIALRHEHSDENAGVNSFLKGRSTNNQRIESYWRQLRQHVLDFYLHLFKCMEKEKMLNISNQMHIDCLRYCFGPLIKEELNNSKKEWNEHRIRKQNCEHFVGGIPNELYHLPTNGAQQCSQQLDLNHVKLLFDKYVTVTPALFSSQFDEIVKLLGKTSISLSAEEACTAYLDFVEVFERLTDFSNNE